MQKVTSIFYPASSEPDSNGEIRRVIEYSSTGELNRKFKPKQLNKRRISIRVVRPIGVASRIKERLFY